MSRITIMVDVSGSMGFPVPGKASRKIDLVSEQIRKIMEKAGLESVRVFTFANSLKDHGDMTVDDLLSHEFHISGGTLMWDNLARVIESLGDDDRGGSGPEFLFCITDGEDQGSNRTSQEVIELAERHGVNLKIILIGLDEVESFDDDIPKENIVQVEDISEISDLTVQSLDKTGAAKPGTLGEQCFVIPSVLPLAEDTKAYVSVVQEGVSKAIPYIESLTGLRYYPVTTYLVDKATIDALTAIKRPEDVESAGNLRKPIEELFRFIYAVALVINRDTFKDANGLDLNIMRKFYKKGFSIEDADRYRNYAERAWCLDHIVHNCFDEKPWTLEDYADSVFFPEISPKKDFVRNVFDDLNEAVNILKRIQRKYRGRVFLSDDYFFSSWGSIQDRDNPDFNLWKGLSRTDRQKLERCIEPDGKWKKDIDSILTGFSIAVKLIIPLVRQCLNSKDALIEIIREMDCYGLYVHPSSEENSQMRRLLTDGGFPNWFYPENTGYVLIAPNKIADRVNDLKTDDMDTDARQSLVAGLILATVVHEHTHAATYEGIGQTGRGCSVYNAPAPAPKHQNQHNIVSESIAEWSELNYFRNDDRIYDVILAHASMDEHLRTWPYAGALVLGKAYQELNGSDQFFRILLDRFREDNDVAWKVFKLIRKLHG